jgi:uncharacterized membrane protein YebE (DUF533 family)
MIRHLTQEQRAALMELLIHLAKADGKVDDIETRLLEQYAYLTGVEACAFNNHATIKELVAPFTTPDARIAVLQELIRLSHYNNYFSDEEQSAIVDVAALMGLPMDLLAQIEDWVMEGIDWERRGENLVKQAERLARH